MGSLVSSMKWLSFIEFYDEMQVSGKPFLPMILTEYHSVINKNNIIC